MTRKKFIAGNWKMNTAVDDACKLAQDIVAVMGTVSDVDIAICPPYTNLSEVGKIIRGTTISLGAQDVYWEPSGAYTGKISGAMLKSVGVTHVIIGHSEQRQYFYESDETVNKKVKAALAIGLLPIICIGETLDERKSGKMNAVIERQTKGAFSGLTFEDTLKCTIAYEPVWAIGTGETATPIQANDAHVFVRKIIAGLYNNEVANELRIQYGGSMKPDNAKELLAQSDVDGGLIGGASLKAASFLGIVKPA